jgi:hypothetical protein
MKLYTITMIDVRPETKMGWSSSCLAVCTSRKEAKELIETNSLDISEGATNDFACIASIESGMPYGHVNGCDFKELWYEWKGSADEGCYQPCEKPEKFRNIVFGL